MTDARGTNNVPANPPWRLARSFLSLSGAETISKVVMLATFAYVARITGPEGFGYLEFALAVVLCGGFVVDQGFGVLGAREIARDPNSTGRLVTEVTSLRLLLAIAVYGCLVAFVSLLDRPAILENLLLLYGVLLFAMPFMLQWVFQGHDCMRIVAILQLVRTAAFAIAVFVLLAAPDQLWTVAVAELCGAAAVVALSIWFARSQLGIAVRPKFTLSTRIIREGSTIGLGQLFWSVRMYGATIIIGLIATEAEVGYFGAAMRIAIGLNVFVWLYFFNLLPSFSRTWQEDRDVFRELLRRAIQTAGWLALGGGVMWILLAPYLVRVVYGNEFMAATVTLRWLSSLCILGSIHGNFRFGLIAAGFERLSTVSAGLGTVAGLVLVPLCYGRWGIDGAGAALCVGEIVVWSSSFVFCRWKLGLRNPARGLGSPILAGALLLGVLILLPDSTPDGAVLGITAAGLGAALLIAEKPVRTAIVQWLTR